MDRLQIYSWSNAVKELNHGMGSCAGFVNCHCHLELSISVDWCQKTGLVNFVVSVVNGRHFPEAEILQAIALAEMKCWNGIVAVGDICNNPLTISQKSNDCCITIS